MSERDDKRSEGPPALESEVLRWQDVPDGWWWAITGNGNVYAWWPEKRDGWQQSGKGNALTERLAVAACRARLDEGDGEAWQLLDDTIPWCYVPCNGADYVAGLTVRCAECMEPDGAHSDGCKVGHATKRRDEWRACRAAAATATPAGEETLRPTDQFPPSR